MVACNSYNVNQIFGVFLESGKEISKHYGRRR